MARWYSLLALHPYGGTTGQQHHVWRDGGSDAAIHVMLMLSHDRLKVCHRCPHQGKPANGVMPCNADPQKRGVRWHADHDDCPAGHFAAAHGFTPDSSPDDILASLAILPPEWPNVQEGWRRQLAFQQHIFHEPPPAPSHPRGIIIGGGGKYLPSVYVTASILRRVHKSTLPIEVWHIGPEEMLPWQRDALVALGNLVTRDASDFAAIGHGYELKSLAVTYCDFGQVYFSDADSFPLCDPAELFDRDGRLAESGAVFCKDQPKFDLTRPQCDLLEFRFTGQPGIETGQFLLDRQRRWQSICLWRWLDSNSRYYYRHGLGDCLTANGAFNLTGGFAWASDKRWAFEAPAVLQHWGDEVAFVHRINGKFSVSADGFYSVQDNHRNDAISLEAQTWQFFGEYCDMAIAAGNVPDIPLPGDVVKSMAHAVGLDNLAAWWTEATSKPCGCEERRAKLNNAARKLAAWWNRGDRKLLPEAKDPMHWELTDKIWWGDFRSVSEVGDKVKLVLCLAHNIPPADNAELRLPPCTPYIRLARPDESACDAAYFQAIDSIIAITKTFDQWPILIHCLGGQHRSPNTALYFATALDGWNADRFVELRKRMLQLRPDVSHAAFGASMDQECRRRCGIQ